MIAIIDYGMGNLRSVEKGFLKVGVPVKVTNRPEDIADASAVVLPGVGAFRDCMKELHDLSLTDSVVNAINQGKPYLGICLGLQVLFSESEEFGTCAGLDVLRGRVVKFEPGVGGKGSGVRDQGAGRTIQNSEFKIQTTELPARADFDVTPNSQPQTLKVPHMGWNELNIKRAANPLFQGIPDRSYFYFVHSYYVDPEDKAVIATTTDYGVEFTSSVWTDNIFAVQFHPEKSQTLGLRMLRNFGNIAAAS